MIKTSINLFLIALLSLAQVEASSLFGKVLSIHDGDTLTFLPNGGSKPAKLRLLGVDTPEIDFNGHSQGEMAFSARDFLRLLLPLGSSIEIELPQNGKDSNNRYLGVIKFNGEDLNAKIISSGWGAVYFIYPYEKSLVKKYLTLSEEAHKQSLGIFSDNYRDESLPYMFRQQSKGVVGSNIVGNFLTKKLYVAEKIEEVPHFHRVFFSSDQMAKSVGFSW